VCTRHETGVCHHHRKRISTFPGPKQEPFYTTINRLEDLSSIGQGLDLRISTLPNSGLGVFSTRYFKNGDVVTWYDGSAFVPSGVQTSQNFLQQPRASHILYVRGSIYAIDGAKPADNASVNQSRARFNLSGAGSLMNSQRGQAANVSCVVRDETLSMPVSTLHNNGGNPSSLPVPYVKFYAKRDIIPGEELFWDYPWDRT